MEASWQVLDLDITYKCKLWLAYNRFACLKWLNPEFFLSPAKHRDHFVRRPSVTLFCHTFQSYVSQATHAFLGMLPLFCVFRTYQKSKMTTLASYRPRHFRLLLFNRWTEFHKTWLEASTYCALPCLFVFRCDTSTKVAVALNMHIIRPFGHFVYSSICLYIRVSIQLSVAIGQGSIVTQWPWLKRNPSVT